MVTDAAEPALRVVLVRGTKQLTIEVRGPTLYTYVHERIEGAGPPTTDAKFFSKASVALRNAEKLRDTRLAAGWQAPDGTAVPDAAARTTEQARRELRAKLLKRPEGTLGDFVECWEEWSRVRLLGFEESFRAETDWATSEGALVAPPKGVKCKRLLLKRWYRDLRSGPASIWAAAFVDDRLVPPVDIPDGPRGRVLGKLREALAGALDVPVLGLWM